MSFSMGDSSEKPFFTDDFSLVEGRTFGTIGTAFTIVDDIWEEVSFEENARRLDLLFRISKDLMESGVARTGFYWVGRVNLPSKRNFCMLVVREDGEATSPDQMPWTCVGKDQEQLLEQICKLVKVNPVFFDGLVEELCKIEEWPPINIQPPGADLNQNELDQLNFLWE